ncbi:MAG: hypothetical protein Q9180_006337, partial [Flavoplaca navasiana]
IAEDQNSRVPAIVREHFTNGKCYQLESDLKKATEEIQRLKKGFEVEVQASQTAAKELQNRQDELAIAQLAVDEERNEIAFQRDKLAQDQKTLEEEKFRWIATREMEVATSGISQLVHEAQQSVRDVAEDAKRQSSTQQEHVNEALDERMQEDRSDGIKKDIKAIVSSIDNLSIESHQRVNALSRELKDMQQSNFDALSQKISDLSNLLSKQNVDIQLEEAPLEP